MSATLRNLVGLALALGAAVLLTVFGAPPKAELAIRLVHEAGWWCAVGAVLLYHAATWTHPLGSMGLHALGPRDVLIAAGAGIVLMAAIVLVYLGLFPVVLLSLSLSHTPNILEMPWWYRAVMVARIAVAEELLFRSVAIERMSALTSRWIAAALSLAAFVGANWSGWDPVNAILAAVTGALLTVLYLWRRNAGVNIVARAIAAGAGYLLH
ncbi:MAG TPA: CPBP family intramembrane glutamic endopeptidase [Rhizomicrobium sp.]|nr:CPBP family intramembrane glutamic endopeptidase [Rhizomicrobium sp.]